jgi:hypothetical protein
VNKEEVIAEVLGFVTKRNPLVTGAAQMQQ